MTFNNVCRDIAAGYADGRSAVNVLPQRLFGGAALSCVVLACAFILYSRLVGVGPDRADDFAVPQDDAPSARKADREVASAAYAELATALHNYARRLTARASNVSLFDSRTLGLPPGTFVKAMASITDSAPAALASRQSGDETTAALSPAPADAKRTTAVAAVPVPRPSPRIRTAALREEIHAPQVAADTPVHTPTIFEKLFGKSEPVALAYAAPEDDSASLVAGRYDRWTAVYDISTRTVYMPDGTRLEAHSGLGDMLDDPRHVNEKNRGATPPDVYDLELRESLFHGVRALRLLPVDDGKVFGRSGLLAHSFMLGPNGDSNGCVSFRNYDAFLQAYLNHSIKRLAVVARLD
jgi:hypothetical protein